MDFSSYRETGHIGGPLGKGHRRALDIRRMVHDTLLKTTSPKRHFAETTQCRKFFSGATLRRKFLMINNESCLREINVIRRALIDLMGDLISVNISSL